MRACVRAWIRKHEHNTTVDKCERVEFIKDIH